MTISEKLTKRIDDLKAQNKDQQEEIKRLEQILAKRYRLLMKLHALVVEEINAD